MRRGRSSDARLVSLSRVLAQKSVSLVSTEPRRRSKSAASIEPRRSLTPSSPPLSQPPPPLRQVYLLPIFDPALSPRNVALIAVRPPSAPPAGSSGPARPDGPGPTAQTAAKALDATEHGPSNQATGAC